MDRVDEQLLDLLARDGRARLTDLAGEVQLSVPAVKRRVDRLERTGVIRGYMAVVDPLAHAPRTEALVEIFTDVRTSKEQLLELLDEHPEVILAFTVAGEADVICLVRTDNPVHLEEFLVTLRANQMIVRTRTQLLLSRLLERPVAFRTQPDVS
jgi:Lrp/AsnC family transcriptional regulator, leucine-responsive regulatory protein